MASGPDLGYVLLSRQN